MYSDMCEISETSKADELRVECSQNNGEPNDIQKGSNEKNGDILKVSCVSNSYFRLCLCCKPVAGLLVFLCRKISYNLFVYLDRQS